MYYLGGGGGSAWRPFLLYGFKLPLIYPSFNGLLLLAMYFYYLNEICIFIEFLSGLGIFPPK